MTMKVFYSDVCPDTEPFLQELDAAGMDYEPININESIPNLKAFLAYRDNHPAFDQVKAENRVGVPVLIRSESDLVFDIAEIAKEDQA